MEAPQDVALRDVTSAEIDVLERFGKEGAVRLVAFAELPGVSPAVLLGAGNALSRINDIAAEAKALLGKGPVWDPSKIAQAQDLLNALTALAAGVVNNNNNNNNNPPAGVGDDDEDDEATQPNEAPDPLPVPAPAPAPVVGIPPAARRETRRIYDLRSERHVEIAEGETLEQHWGHAQWHSHGPVKRVPQWATGPQSIHALGVDADILRTKPLYFILNVNKAPYALLIYQRIQRLAVLWNDRELEHDAHEDKQSHARRSLILPLMDEESRLQDAQRLAVYRNRDAPHMDNYRMAGPHLYVLSRTYMELQALADRLYAAYAHSNPLFAYNLSAADQGFLRDFFAAPAAPNREMGPGPDCAGYRLPLSQRYARGQGNQKHVVRARYPELVDSRLDVGQGWGPFEGHAAAAAHDDPVNNAGISGGHFICCGMPVDHAGCFVDTYSTVTNQPRRYKIASWKSPPRPGLLQADIAAQWLATTHRGTAWLNKVDYNAIHARITELKQRIAPDVARAFSKGIEARVFFQHLSVSVLNTLVQMLRLEHAYNSFYCGQSTLPGNAAGWIDYIGRALRLHRIASFGLDSLVASLKTWPALMQPLGDAYALVFSGSVAVALKPPVAPVVGPRPPSAGIQSPSESDDEEEEEDETEIFNIEAFNSVMRRARLLWRIYYEATQDGTVMPGEDLSIAIHQLVPGARDAFEYVDQIARTRADADPIYDTAATNIDTGVRVLLSTEAPLIALRAFSAQPASDANRSLYNAAVATIQNLEKLAKALQVETQRFSKGDRDLPDVIALNDGVAASLQAYGITPAVTAPTVTGGNDDSIVLEPEEDEATAQRRRNQFAAAMRVTLALRNLGAYIVDNPKTKRGPTGEAELKRFAGVERYWPSDATEPVLAAISQDIQEVYLPLFLGNPVAQPLKPIELKPDVFSQLSSGAYARLFGRPHLAAANGFLVNRSDKYYVVQAIRLYVKDVDSPAADETKLAEYFTLSLPRGTGSDRYPLAPLQTFLYRYAIFASLVATVWYRQFGPAPQSPVKGARELDELDKDVTSFEKLVERTDTLEEDLFEKNPVNAAIRYLEAVGFAMPQMYVPLQLAETEWDVSAWE